MARVIGRKVLYYDRVTSTNDIARSLAEAGEPEGVVVFADKQTAGRGRKGKIWTVPPLSSIQFSVIVRPLIPASEASGLVQMSALSVCEALREFAESIGFPRPISVTLKWPNDVLLNGKKCAGILIETGIEGQALAFAIVGLGINVNFSMREYPDLAEFATTLADEFGHDVDRGALREALLNKLDAYYELFKSENSGRKAIFEAWRSRLATIGQSIRVSTGEGIEEGVALDVDVDGALILQRGEGTIRLYSGDTTVLKGREGRSLS